MSWRNTKGESTPYLAWIIGVGWYFEDLVRGKLGRRKKGNIGRRSRCRASSNEIRPRSSPNKSPTRGSFFLYLFFSFRDLFGKMFEDGGARRDTACGGDDSV